MLNKKLMKAARFYKPGEPLRIEEIPIPVIGPEDVLLDVKATGICGSDIHILEGVTPTGFSPITLGHEISGVVVEVGTNVRNWKTGDRVCVNCIVSCGSCYNCLRGRFSICTQRKLLGIHLDGGLAEYCKVPATNLIKLPENIPFEHGSIITDAVATPYHALIKRAKLELGQTVAIFGIGGLGYSAVQLARIAGASKVIAVGIIAQNLERALNIGADEVINSSNQDPVEVIKNMTNGEGVDVALECIGMQTTIEQAVKSAFELEEKL